MILVKNAFKGSISMVKCWQLKFYVAHMPPILMLSNPGYTLSINSVFTQICYKLHDGQASEVWINYNFFCLMQFPLSWKLVNNVRCQAHFVRFTLEHYPINSYLICWISLENEFFTQTWNGSSPIKSPNFGPCSESFLDHNFYIDLPKCRPF